MLKLAFAVGLMFSGVANSNARALDVGDARAIEPVRCHLSAKDTCASWECSAQNTDLCRSQNNRLTNPPFRLTQHKSGNDTSTVPTPQPDLNTLKDLFAALRACWRPPSRGLARADMEITVRISFKRSGAIFGAPRVTFATPGIPLDVRDLYRNAVADSLAACTPFTFTDAFGNAVAGRPILVRYIDNRIETRRAERNWQDLPPLIPATLMTGLTK